MSMAEVICGCLATAAAQQSQAAEGTKDTSRGFWNGAQEQIVGLASRDSTGIGAIADGECVDARFDLKRGAKRCTRGIEAMRHIAEARGASGAIFVPCAIERGDLIAVIGLGMCLSGQIFDGFPRIEDEAGTSGGVE
jgi:hypothetical protein